MSDLAGTQHHRWHRWHANQAAIYAIYAIYGPLMVSADASVAGSLGSQKGREPGPNPGRHGLAPVRSLVLLRASRANSFGAPAIRISARGTRAPESISRRPRSHSWLPEASSSLE
jgi:hypothetical protein